MKILSKKKTGEYIALHASQKANHGKYSKNTYTVPEANTEVAALYQDHDFGFEAVKVDPSTRINYPLLEAFANKLLGYLKALPPPSNAARLSKNNLPCGIETVKKYFKEKNMDFKITSLRDGKGDVTHYNFLKY